MKREKIEVVNKSFSGKGWCRVSHCLNKVVVIDELIFLFKYGVRGEQRSVDLVSSTIQVGEKKELLLSLARIIDGGVLPSKAALFSFLIDTLGNSIERIEMEDTQTYTVDDALLSLGFGKFQALVFLYSGVAYAAEAMEVTILSFIGSPVQSEWSLSAHEKSIIPSVVFAGMLTGAYSWGVVSDTYGRRMGFLFTALVTSVVGFVSTFAPNYISLLIFRFFVGIGLGGGPVLFAWFLEFVPAPYRGAWMGVFSFCWSIGTILEASLAWGVMPTLGWRWLLALSSLPSFLLLIFYFFTPESPRYLCMNGQKTEAMHILETMARMNKKALPSGELISDRKVEANKLDELDGDNNGSQSTRAEQVQEGGASFSAHLTSKVKCIGSLYKLLSRELIRTTLLLWIGFFGNAFSYYGVILLTSSLTDQDSKCRSVNSHKKSNEGNHLYKDVFITSLAELPGLILAALLVDKIGRKLTIATMMFATFAFLMPLIFHQKEFTITALLFCARICVTGSITTLSIYAPEIYPTFVRSTGFGVANSMGKIGGIITPLVTVGLIDGCHRAAAVIVFECVVFLTGLAAILFPVETKGYANGIGVNWGIQASHPLPPSILVEMLKDNKIQKVKLFGAEEGPLNALRNTGIQVMVGIQNDMLPSLAMDMTAAEKWVSKNVSSYVNIGVNISCVAVGNEPLLKSLNETYLQYCFPALQNIQSALVKAGLGSQVKVTIPLNAGVYDSANGKPSGGEFRPEIKDLMLSIVKFLNDNNSPFIVNIYPFISLNNDPNFPIDYAFFEGSSSPVIDGSISYTNTFDANHDTLVWALKKNGFGNISIVVGEIGWPTDGNVNANVRYAQKFNQGLVNRVLSGQGTPMRPAPIDAYLFSLLDEDEKSILPGNFERHWGILSFDGQAKYQLKLGESELVGAKGVKYMKSRWCVLKPSASLDDPNVAPGVSFACGNADCTSLGYKTSCSDLDARGNISYAFNSYYQKNDQDDRACQFSNLGTITDQDPSTQTCRFPIMIDVSFGASWRRWSVREHGFASLSAASLPFFLLGLL
ncbi:hypothetical protein HPP92_010336 [Vanilla planifolia]|uniref:glucan endo-1,3-beta-D-glucosidase n=1 Tax=Vanilla planifolia TaxID=51239 RepID=A0A835R3X3_VANPL|nr:hypothetical protein HPP92_010336 [Vanilla planifolia]